MHVFFDRRQLRHDPQFYLVRGRVTQCAERPERAELLLAAVEGGGHRPVVPGDFGPSPRAAIHTPEYLDFLATAYEHWQALGDSGPEVLANIHPNRHGLGRSPHIVARAGWHMADLSCAMGPDTFASACVSANTAVAAAQAVLDGEPAAYALCRPPGHHAFADMAGGFCFLNNTAIAAQWLRQAAPRVAILDVDVHHGNGTQGIFYARGDVLTVSVHADPQVQYPWYWGHAQERGSGPGEGCNLNLPQPAGAGDAEVLAAIETARPLIEAFAPGYLVVALGLDAFAGDPLGLLSVTTPGFRQIGQAIARFGLPTVIVQEGGYLCEELGENLVATLAGVEEAA
ncbi:MAG: histone deacetylase family protein [Rhodospirillaceae bacterium]|nr:histone deacetylase family protein [Rhodospirillaceae bacterium]